MPTKPILVTGSHRSGTTWVGRMLAAAPSVMYIHELFNPTLARKNRGICRIRFDSWFTYISAANEQDYYQEIRQALELRYNLPAKLQTVRSRRALQRAIRERNQFAQSRRERARPLLKDPIAFFSAEWLAARFAMDVVVLIRHPAAFAGSLKVKNWRFPFSHFLEQPLLMEAYLHPYEAEIAQFAQKEQDIVDQAALLWKLIHYVILQFQQKRPDWLFVRHEELSQNPAAGFRFLFTQLGLDYSAEAARTVQAHSAPGMALLPANEDQLFTALRRDSAANVWTWKERLTPAEIGRVRDRVAEISQAFYTETEWK
ncbi:MAG TPA: hypothetical protein EYH05_09335 [Anaerolineae bacterium]|nr:hypothetical protein [Anaerolineae bacterium]